MPKSLAVIAAFILAPAAMAQQETPPPPPSGGGMPTPEQIFGFMDANKDGFIARDEARGPMAKHFEHLDADKDSKISPAELKSAMAAMHPPEPPQGSAEESAE